MGRLCYPTQHRAGSWYFSQKAVTVQGGGDCTEVKKRKRWRIFAIQAQNFLAFTSFAVQSCQGLVNYPGAVKLI